MKKKILLLTIFSSIILSGCSNKQTIDTNYSSKKAIIEGIGEVSIESWNDYLNSSDMVQIVTTDGTVYFTHSSNVIIEYKK